jgi:hypothetical protein
MSDDPIILRQDTSDAIRLAHIPPVEKQDELRLLTSIAISLDLIAQALGGGYHVRTPEGTRP